MENPATFPLLHLPRVALDEVMSMMVLYELIYFSKISPRTEMIVKTLPARKRTFEVSLKISNSYSVTIHRSKMKWELASTRDFSNDKVIDFYSCDFQLQQIKEIYGHINRILNFSSKKVFYTLSYWISDHKSVIDWLKRQHESVEELYISSAPSYDNDLEYLLRNVKATKSLSLKVKNELHFVWDELLPKNLYELDLEAATGISLQQLLRLNISRITLRNSKLTGREINLFLKSWMDSESNLNLESFKVYIWNFNLSDTVVDVPHQPVRYENGRMFGNTEVYYGVEIEQSSGKTGVLSTGGGQIFVALFIF